MRVKNVQIIIVNVLSSYNRLGYGL